METKYRKLSQAGELQFLRKLREHSLDIKKTCADTGLNGEEGRWYKKKFDAYTSDKLNLAIYKLERRLFQIPFNFPFRDYTKQDSCEHENFTLFLKCKDCTKVVGENQLDEALEIILREKERRKNLKELVITL